MKSPYNIISGAYVEDMYEAWAHDPKSVHPSWDSYFRYIKDIKLYPPTCHPRNGGYQSPPTLGMSTKANEMPLASLVPGGIGGLGKGGADTHMVEAHLAVQGAIRSVNIVHGVESGGDLASEKNIY